MELNNSQKYAVKVGLTHDSTRSVDGPNPCPSLG